MFSSRISVSCCKQTAKVWRSLSIVLCLQSVSFRKQKWSHSVFLIVFSCVSRSYLHSLCVTILSALFMYHGLICILYLSRSYLHSSFFTILFAFFMCHDLICILHVSRSYLHSLCVTILFAFFSINPIQLNYSVTLTFRQRKRTI